VNELAIEAAGTDIEAARRRRFAKAVAVAAFVSSLGVLTVPGRAEACFTIEQAPSDSEDDAYSRQVADRLEELFEAEVLSTEGNIWEMRVTRVYRGRLHAGMILRGPPHRDECGSGEMRPGHTGFAWVGFGPAGPTFVGRFVGERRVASLRRIGALPPPRASPRRLWRNRGGQPR
jgi:hypothetical protein